jgi:hypothetical protein
MKSLRKKASTRTVSSNIASTHTSASTVVTRQGSSHLEMHEAVGRLGTDFQNVAAAAAVVAATTQGSAMRGNVQFGQGDYVLVMLTLLEIADREGNRDLYTVDPVNKVRFKIYRRGKLRSVESVECFSKAFAIFSLAQPFTVWLPTRRRQNRRPEKGTFLVRLVFSGTGSL